MQVAIHFTILIEIKIQRSKHSYNTLKEEIITFFSFFILKIFRKMNIQDAICIKKEKQLQKEMVFEIFSINSLQIINI